jgi:hypothetical protein
VKYVIFPLAQWHELRLSRCVAAIPIRHIRAAVPEARFGLPEVKWAIHRFGGWVPHRYGRESRRTARMVTALARSCADAGGGGVFSREHCGQ